jgi:hypothetical protein
MAADCTVITVDHPHSAGSEVVGDAGFVTAPSIEDVSARLSRAIAGERPEANPVTTAAEYDWSAITSTMERYFQDLC